MLVLGIQQNDSVIHMYVYILFQITFPFRLLLNIEQSSLCYTVGPCWLHILNITVCTCSNTNCEFHFSEEISEIWVAEVSVWAGGVCEGTKHLERKHVGLSYHIPLPHTCCPGELGEEL